MLFFWATGMKRCQIRAMLHTADSLLTVLLMTVKLHGGIRPCCWATCVCACVCVLPKCLISKLHAIKIQSIPSPLSKIATWCCAEVCGLLRTNANCSIWYVTGGEWGCKGKSIIKSMLFCCSIIGSFHIFVRHQTGEVNSYSHVLLSFLVDESCGS